MPESSTETDGRDEDLGRVTMLSCGGTGFFVSRKVEVGSPFFGVLQGVFLVNGDSLPVNPAGSSGFTGII